MLAPVFGGAICQSIRWVGALTKRAYRGELFIFWRRAYKARLPVKDNARPPGRDNACLPVKDKSRLPGRDELLERYLTAMIRRRITFPSTHNLLRRQTTISQPRKHNERKKHTDENANDETSHNQIENPAMDKPPRGLGLTHYFRITIFRVAVKSPACSV